MNKHTRLDRSQPNHVDHLDEFTLNELLDTMLSAAEQTQAEQHLAICADCSRKLDELLQMVHALETLPEVAPQHNLAHAVVQRIAHLPAPQPALPWKTMLAQLTVALLVLGAAWSLVTTTVSGVVSPLRQLSLPWLPSLHWATFVQRLQLGWNQLLSTSQQIRGDWFDLTQSFTIPEYSFSVWGGLLLATGLGWLLTNRWLLLDPMQNPPLNHPGEAK